VYVSPWPHETKTLAAGLSIQATTKLLIQVRFCSRAKEEEGAAERLPDSFWRMFSAHEFSPLWTSQVFAAACLARRSIGINPFTRTRSDGTASRRSASTEMCKYGIRRTDVLMSGKRGKIC